MNKKQMNVKETGKYLAMDTSTSSMTAAVLENGNLLGEWNTHADRNHSIGLLPNIKELLSSLELKSKDLKAISVGNGPGSYTGVRIAVTVAKTLAWSLGIDLIGVSSLEAMALGGRRRWLSAFDSERKDMPADGTSWIIPLMDARRNQAFTGIYEARGNSDTGSWRSLVPDGIHVMDKWVEQLQAMAADTELRREITGVEELEAPQRVLFVGETGGFASFLEPFTERWEGAAFTIPHMLQAYDIGVLAYPKLLVKEIEDVHTFVPNYTQLAEAEVKLLAKVQKGEE